MLKVDVEGHELSVFRGADNVLLKNRPRVVYFEVCPPLARSAGFAPQAAAAMLLELGYALYRVRGDGSLRQAALEEICGITLDNWVALHT
jgi:hypothetical protein